MVHGKYFTSHDDITPILELRYAVFSDEQGFSRELERDKFDDMSFYALVYDQNDVPAATGRLFIDDENRFHIGRMCTRKDMRGQGLGDLAIRMLLDLALRMNAPYVVVGSQLPAMGFYKKYGFKEVGEPYMDENCAHQLLVAQADEICVGCTCSSCAGCAQAESCTERKD
ncbi:MAG: GNAT family N-acetyltransferase [Eubacteriales bacterium]|nr:GNAT family N-acetyltransferase [Eubacteriales bacterium]